MIIMILSGGMGNQMFEYAAARALALRNNTQLVLNTTNGFKRDKVYNRVYCLDVFNIKYYRRKLLSFDFPLGFVFDKLSRKLGRHLFFPWYRYLYEKNTPVADLLVPMRNRKVVLTGVWPQLDTFSDYADTIRQDFTLSIPLPSQVQYYVNNISNSEIPVVAMGVRIYQEIKDEKVRNQSFFYYDGKYFERALSYYKEKIGKFKLLIFTQAKDWVKENVCLEGINFEYVNTSKSDADAVYDMLIMSKCHHYILSDSSFYFWSCWLNSTENKQVVIPQGWKNCVMEEWIRL